MSEQEIFITKQRKLKNAKKILNEEFFGIEKVIDEVITIFGNWYLFNEFQTKPTVINLWGTTGVGKTSLVKRLIELMNFENIFYDYLLYFMDERPLFNEIFSDTNFQNNSPQLIFFLDDFHRNKYSIDRRFAYRHRKKLYFWEILDSGKITYNFFRPYINKLNCPGSTGNGHLVKIKMLPYRHYYY